MGDGSRDERATVVVADDAAELRALVRTRLRLSGRFDVVGEAVDGLEAVALAERHQPDLVLLDVSMPRMDGLEALPAVIAASPRTKVVMFSGFAEAGLAARALELGAVGFVEKSVPVEELAERIFSLAHPHQAASVAAAPAEAATADETRVLAQHLERFREVFEDAAIGMATVTLAGHVVRANRALAQLLGHDVAHLTGSSYGDLARDLDADAFVDALQRAGGQPAEVVQLEHTVLTDAGSRDLRATLAPVSDEDGRPLYLFLQVQDVTAQRAAEEALRESEERFRLLVEAVQDYAIFMLDPHGNVASWNLGAQRSKGYAAEEIIGQHFRVFYPPDKQEARHPEWELGEAVREGHYEEEGWRIRKDGTQFWANVVITAVRNSESQLIGFTKVTRDMTERQAMLQRLEAANARLTRAAVEQADFLAVTAHELRTPVRVVTGCAETLARHWTEMTEQDRLDLFESMETSAGRLRRLLDDLLTASRLEAGAVELHPVALDLCQVLTSAASSARSTHPAGEIRIECPAGAQVCADSDRLAQILDNLLGNALRHGTAPVTVRVVDEVDQVAIHISDAGPGVPEPMRDRLFQRFATGESRRGTGLGLFIVRELARAHGGDARYDESDRFVVTLPRTGRTNGTFSRLDAAG